MPQYANDNFCDDQNNNERCNWDGGACCEGRLFNPNWDKFCTECECLDPCAGIVCLGYHSEKWIASQSFICVVIFTVINNFNFLAIQLMLCWMTLILNVKVEGGGGGKD